MMGHRDKLKDGDEWDTVSRYWRRMTKRRAGDSRRVKNKINRRARHQQRRAGKLEWFDWVYSDYPYLYPSVSVRATDSWRESDGV